MFVLFLSLFLHYNLPPFSSDWIMSIFSHLYSPYFQVFIGRKADPGQSRGKPDASAEW